MSVVIELLAVALGLVVILGVFVDATLTTLTVSTAAGPLTGWLLPVMWRVLQLSARRRRLGRRLLPLSGAVLLLSTVLTWVAGLWCGWWLVFAGSGVVEEASSGRAAGVVDVGYFSGMTMVTLGTGDFVAGSSGWRFVSALASLSGLFLVTLSITYLVSVLSAVVARRALAIHIRGLGDSAEGIVTRAWTGTGYSRMFQQQLITLTPIVATAAEQHLAYPVLHYFHAPRPELSAPVALASLSDVLLITGELTDEAARPDRLALGALSHAVDQYVEAAGEVAWLPDRPSPPPPPVRSVEHHGIPVVAPAQAAVALQRAEGRRAGLNRLLASDAWTWPGADGSPPAAPR